jgi:hypothetical protein
MALKDFSALRDSWRMFAALRPITRPEQTRAHRARLFVFLVSQILRLLQVQI